MGGGPRGRVRLTAGHQPILFERKIFDWVHAPGQGPHVDATSWFVLIVVMIFPATLTASLGLYLGTVVDPRKVQMIFAVAAREASRPGIPLCVRVLLL